MSLSRCDSGLSGTFPASQADIIELARSIASERHLLDALALPACNKAVLMQLIQFNTLAATRRGLVLVGKVDGEMAGFATLRESTFYGDSYGIKTCCESFAVFSRYRMTRASMRFVDDVIYSVGAHFEMPDFCARIAASNSPMIRLVLRAGFELMPDKFVWTNPQTGKEQEMVDVIYRAPR